MSKLRNLVAALFSIGLVFSSYGGLSIAQAVTAPTLVEASAENTGGTSAKEAGDTVDLEFSEDTNKFAITEDNIDDLLSLNNGHSWLDGDGELGDVDWNSDGDELTITLSDGTSLPTVAVADTVTIDGDDIEDEDGNPFTGSVVIEGSFTADEDDDDEDCDDVIASVSNDDEDEDVNEDEDNDCDDHSGSGKLECNNALINGKLYKIGDEATVYLAVRHCVLKPFRGAAVFHARGLKFQDVITLSTLPADVTISAEPVLPEEGTLVKGSEKTVWFIDHAGKRRGFVNAEVFTKLGFKFGQVETISDSDLNELPTDTSNISDDSHHPDGALIKCGNSAAVFLVVGGERFPFASAAAFEGRGHSFEHVLNIDCGRFAYQESTAITE